MEELADIVDKNRRLFHGREVAAFVEFVPAHDIMCSFGNAAYWQCYVIRKNGDRGGGWRRLGAFVF